MPSISSLVHAEDCATMADNRSISSGKSSAGSSSPGRKELAEKMVDEENKSSRVTSGTADIASGKLNMSIATGAEDARAIRVLDRKFMV